MATPPIRLRWGRRPIPEPPSVVFLATGLLGAARVRWAGHSMPSHSRWFIGLILGIAVASQAQVLRHHASPVSPDLLARVRNAPKIFIANAGQDESLSTNTDFSGSAFSNIYAAVAEWPGVKMVDTPAAADLIFGVSDSEDLNPVKVRDNPKIGDGYENEPILTFHVRVLDPHTQKVLWEDQNVLQTAVMHFGNLDNLINKAIEQLLNPFVDGVPLPHLPKKLPIAPYPAALRAPKTLFLRVDNGQVPAARMTELQGALQQQFATEYTMVDSANKADLVVSLSATSSSNWGLKRGLAFQSMQVNEIDPATGTLLWSITTAFTQSEKTPQLQIAHTMPYFWRKWKLVVGHP